MAKKTAKLTANPAKKRAGRPAWEPTETQRGEVRGLTVGGFTEEQIADYLGVDAKTLRKHCRADLDFSRMRVIANAANNVVKLGNGVPAVYDEKGRCIRAEIPMSLGPNAFLLKTQGKALGWSERLEHTGANGQPLMPDLTKLSDEQVRILAEAERILALFAPANAGDGGTGKTTH